jgi:hypothetical protein
MMRYDAAMADPIDALASELATTPAAELHDRLTEAVADLSLRDRFTLLHRLGVYHHPDSFSGPAATLDETAALREALPEIVAQWNITTMLDVPCGDFAWMRHLNVNVDYIGADIVSELVIENQKRYASDRRRFVVLDATRDSLPAVDLIVCRDLLIHLSLADCFSVLRNFVSSGSRLLLTSHFENRSSNPEIVSGDFRPINLCRAPFNLPAPLRVINERSNLGGGEFTDRSMALWELRTVRRALGIA